MPYQLIYDGVVRDFEFYAPYGWPDWHERAFTEDGRKGLPLIIALHGGGQLPANFAIDWPFPLLFNSEDNANWEDRAFVLYPYGFSYVPGLDGQPDRGWNTGFSGSYLTTQNDVSFIRAMIAAVKAMLQKELDKLGVKRPPIDEHRRFLFGYSMGGMMAYRLVNQMPNHWGALWMMASAFGGRSHEGLTPTVTHPPQGHSSVSLFAHHGENDDVVPPGDRNDPSGRVVSNASRLAYTATGLDASSTDNYATSLRTLAAAILAYRVYNDCKSTAYQTLTGQTTVLGANDGVKIVFRQDTNAANPEVIVYRDTEMTHTNFVANRYFQARDVWDFFKAHPRIDI